MRHALLIIHYSLKTNRANFGEICGFERSVRANYRFLILGAAMVLAETVDSGAQTLSVPLAGEDFNGEISVETNTDWLAADSTGEIQVEALS